MGSVRVSYSDQPAVHSISGQRGSADTLCTPRNSPYCFPFCKPRDSKSKISVPTQICGPCTGDEAVQVALTPLTSVFPSFGFFGFPASLFWTSSLFIVVTAFVTGRLFCSLDVT